MIFTLGQIAAELGAQCEGDSSIRLSGAAEPSTATADHLALAMKPEYAEGLSRGKARVAMLWQGADWRAYGLEGALFMPRPRFAMAGVTRIFDRGPELAPGIHPTAFVDPRAVIGEGAAIGPHAVIGARVRIGARCRIAPLVSIAEDAVIGDDALLLAGAHIGARVRVGNRVILQPGAAVGGDGFSFVTPEKSGVENVRDSLGDLGAVTAQSWTRIHSLGTVEIGDDVEIGANSTVDRGTIRATRIGRGTKLDNLVQIGHNVEIGEDCLICGQAGVAGSTRLGNRVVMAGQSGLNDNIFVGDDVVIGGGSKVVANVPSGRVLLGYPATQMATQLATYKALRRLPRLFRDVAALQKAVSKPEQSD